MENPIVSWLFETDAVRVCPEGQPFWYTSGKLGPFYINTQFLYGSEEAANALLTVIEQACAGDKLRFYGKVYGEIEKQLAACPIYRQLIDLMTEAARKMDVDFVSGGERRDFFFSMPVARKLGRAWIPAVEGLGAKIACSLAVVDRDQGGSQILADAGCPLTTLVVIKPELFETAHKMGRITDKQLALVLHFIDDPDAFMRSFLLAHPDFLANELAKGGKSAQRAQLCIDSGFAPAEALPKA